MRSCHVAYFHTHVLPMPLPTARAPCPLVCAALAALAANEHSYCDPRASLPRAVHVPVGRKRSHIPTQHTCTQWRRGHVASLHHHSLLNKHFCL